jgi:hypothetical protein
MANKISVIIDVAVDRANKSLGDFRNSIKDADGAAAKMKVGINGALDSIKANAANLALAGGAAIFAFGAKAVDDFNKLALEAGRLSDALGIPLDPMSRLMEVAGDIDIPVSTLERSIGRMNRTASSSPKVFDDIGAAIARNEDGTINVQETFMNVVDALNSMPDSARKAEYAQRIFGRGWQDMAELIGQGSDTITKSMSEVSEQQAISPEEVQKARDYRAAMDNLGDAMATVTLAVGGSIVPALTDVANAVGFIIEKTEELEEKTNVNFFDGLFSADFWKFGDTWDKGPGAILKDLTGFEGKPVANEFDKVEGAVDDVGDAVRDHGNLTSAVEIFVDRATDRMERAWDDLNSSLSDRSAYLDIQDALADVEASYMTAMDTADKSLGEQEADARNLERAVIDLKGKVNEYAKDVALLPPEMATEINALIDEGNFAEAERRLATLEKTRIARVTVETFIPGGGVNVKTGAKFHSGGVVGMGNFASNEVPAVLEKGEMVLTEGQQSAVSAAMGGGGGANITINMPPGSDGDSVVRAIRQYVRRNGPIQGIT